VLFDAYRTDLFTLANYRSLQVELSDICDVFFVFHGSYSANLCYPSNTLILDDYLIFDKFPNEKSIDRNIIPLNCDLKTLAAIEEIDSYERYISIEFDVICIDKIAETMSRLIEATKTADLAASYIETRDQQPEWMWWSSLQPPPGTNIQPDYVRRSFLPLSVYSRRFMQIYRQELQAGWAGHQEILLPTIACKHGMKTVVLNQRSLHFTAWPQFNIGRPDGLDHPSLPAFLHPVKTVQDYQKLPTSIQNSACLSELIKSLV
jgi:hypothetical protein